MLKIQPVRVFPKTATDIDFGAITLVPFVRAFAEWHLYDAGGNPLAAGMVETTPEQYAQWGTDDNYITECFLANLELVRA